MSGPYPVPTNGVSARTADQHRSFVNDITMPLDAYPPDTARDGLILPIDQPYRLPDLATFLTVPNTRGGSADDPSIRLIGASPPTDFSVTRRSWTRSRCSVSPDPTDY
jgi:hypothetical protein